MLPSSGISQKSGALIVRYNHKKEQISFVCYCLENASIGHNFGTTGPIHTGFSAKCTSPNEHFNQIETMKMVHVRLQTDFFRSHHIHIYKLGRHMSCS